MKKIGIISLVGLLLLATACGVGINNKSNGVVQATDVMKDVKANSVDTKDKLTDENGIVLKDFSTGLLKNTFDETTGNTLVSPISVIYALGMTANGADGETLKQMENVFGLSIEDLNGYLNAYLKSLPTGAGYEFNIANSIWIKDGVGFEPNEEFLQKNKDYYDAKIFLGKFDAETVKEINKWVEENTDGMIEGILDSIPEAARMYLINALALRAEWENQYSEGQVLEGDFTKSDGETEKTEFMYDKVFEYIEGESEKGFVKQYKDRKYSFVALLPNEGSSIKEYVSNLSGEKIHNLLENVEDTEVSTSLPKFENEFSLSLNDALKAMGVENAFSEEKSDLSKIGDNLFISNVLHKTYISVHEKGTEAGAVTSVEIETTSAPTDPPKEVYLNRPFVYMIIDNELNMPIFLGTYGGK